jgi:hypothetical protein
MPTAHDEPAPRRARPRKAAKSTEAMQRADDLLKQMTIEEKAMQYVRSFRPPR